MGFISGLKSTPKRGKPTMKLHTCVSPSGRFVYGIHRPHFSSDNLRETDDLADLGRFPDGCIHRNTVNFPSGPVHEPAADPIFEVPNAFPFRGTTYIAQTWAEAQARSPETIALPKAPALSFFDGYPDEQGAAEALRNMDRPLRLALALSSTDARDLCCLAHMACTFCMDESSGVPWGIVYETRSDGRVRAKMADPELFDAVANNTHLPDAYKQAMVLRPGAQGASEIVGERHQTDPHSHVFEYLRKNSYIPWGHYAANMADDAVRYRLKDLGRQDICGMRHLYYQRSYVRLAGLLGLPASANRRSLNEEELERLRQTVHGELAGHRTIDFDRTLWGWNFGFDYTPSGYRLHASHQQVHQQFALVPARIPMATGDGLLPAYACGDMVGEFVKAYRHETGKGFFECYQLAIEKNRRMDGNRHGPKRLSVFEDERVLLFVPKAQTSQWELQVMPKRGVGNIVEADTRMRQSLDRALFVAVKTLGAMGARMITTIEFSKSILEKNRDQRLLISLLPRLPQSPGAFSEAQLRWINGHYPEDFAQACRSHLPQRP